MSTVTFAAIKSKVEELCTLPSTCPELKAVCREWLAAVGTDRQQEMNTRNTVSARPARFVSSSWKIKKSFSKERFQGVLSRHPFSYVEIASFLYHWEALCLSIVH